MSTTLLDNSMAQSERLPISHTDATGNTYQDRKIDDGSTHRVLKNFPREDELLSLLPEAASDVSFKLLSHYWLFEYTLCYREAEMVGAGSYSLARFHRSAAVFFAVPASAKASGCQSNSGAHIR